jgi:phosphoserine phosphatase RsbU/P
MSQILIIDDDPTMRLTLSRTLKKQGYAVTIAKNGEEGLEQAKLLHPSLIICDWMMPKMDGLDVCRQVKAIAELSNSYFILLTAKDNVGDLVKGLENGADDFLSKPPNLNELRARVRAGLRLHQANQELQNQKQILEKELSQAAEYVRSLIPEPLADKNIVTDACFLPSAQLGGDCFDYFWLDSDHFAMYLLDVSGHGVGSALLSVSILNLLRTRSLPRAIASDQANINFYAPGEVLAALNEYFQMSKHQEMYFTIWYGVFECSTRLLTYSSGGHPPALLLTPDRANLGLPRVQHLHTAGLPVGMITGVEYDSVSCEVPIGSRLYLYSDGAYEITQPDQSIWGMDALIRALQNAFITANNSDSSGISSMLFQIRKAMEPNLSFEDDISLLEVSLA